MLAAVGVVVREHGEQGWLVGGSVRDREFGRFSPDIDIVVTGDAEAVARRTAQLLDVPWFTLSEEHRAYRVVGEVAHVDIAAVRGGSILSDLAERDFTVNAMAIPVGGSELIDPFGGLGDLRARRLRAVSSRIFDDDPLRLMRAARFATQFGLEPDGDSLRTIRAHADLLWRAAPERIANELFLTLAGRQARSATVCWDAMGLLPRLFPEVAARGEPSPAALSRLAELTFVGGRASPLFPVAEELLRERLHEPVDGAVDRRTALQFAGLLWGLDPAEACQVGRRLKLSNALLSLLETSARMSRWKHAGLSCAPGSGFKMADGTLAGPRDPADRAAVLFLWDASPWEPEVIILAASAGPIDRDDAGSLELDELPFEDTLAPGIMVARRLMALWATREVEGVPHLPFDGDDLMRELKLEPGPLLGQALRGAKLAWEAGEVATAEEALKAARAAVGQA
jgi:tRNA nucleotidyltransferase/poly(A) polymerase